MVLDKYTNSPWYKNVIFAVNAVLLFIGFLLILWGVLTIRAAGDFEAVDHAVSTGSLPVLSILLGFGVFVVATLGIVGTITENFYITATYSVLLLIITILQLALVLWMIFKRESFIQTMDDAVEQTFSQNDKKSGYPFDVLELTFECCGYNNYQDYAVSVSNSCCGEARSSSKKCKKDDYVKKPGCKAAFTQFWATNTNLVRWVGILIVLLEIVILLLAITLVRKFRNSRTANLEHEQQQKQKQKQQQQSQQQQQQFQP